MSLTREYFGKYTNEPVFELSKPINIKIYTNSGNEFERTIKFVWAGGIGYEEETRGGCTWCSVGVGSVMTMPDNTKITCETMQQFANEVETWDKNKHGYEISSEVEFMDI